MHKISYVNTHDLMLPHAHGFAEKHLAVLHETVSRDEKGLADIVSVEDYLAGKDYGIHGMTDLEGHKAWAFGLGSAVFWQAGGVNTESIGIEQVSFIPALLEDKVISVAQAKFAWAGRHRQLNATAQLLAAWHNADKERHVLKVSDGSHDGVTSHWNVSQHHPESEGHSDCWPVHHGGYYPLGEVVELARTYASLGYHF